MLIFKNLKFRFFKWFWLKTKTFFKYALGIKRSSTRQQNLYRFFWRFLFIGFLLFILFSNKSPWGYLSTGKKTDTISLYAGTVIGNFENNAWLNMDNAKGAAEIGPDEDLILFNIDNSAVYQGGDGDVVLSNWLPLTLGEDNLSENELPVPYTRENESDEEIAGEQISNEELTTSSIETALPEPVIPAEASTANNIIFENKASSSNSSLDPEKNWIGFDEAIDDGSSAGAQTFGQDEHPASEENQVEVIDISQESIDAIDNIEIIDEAGEIESPASQNETELSNDLSWINDIFQAKEAQAQEYISNEPEKLSDLGIFQKASLKISLAAFNNMQKQIEDLKEAEIIDNDAADNSSGVGEQAGRTNEEESTDTSGNETNEEDSFIKASSTGEISQSYWWDKIVNYAQAQDDYETKISIWYSLDQRTGTSGRVIWEQLDTVSADRTSNKLNNGYLSWELPAIESWDSLDDLQIKIKGEYGGGTEFVLYLDSLWLEVEYEKESEMDILEKRQRWEEALELLSEQLVFGINENGKFRMRYNKNEEKLWGNIKEMIGLGNYWENIEIKASLIDNDNRMLELPILMIFYEDGEFQLEIENNQTLQPGKYRIKFEIIDTSGEETEEFEIYQDFSWGVLAFNTNKSVYQVGETGYLQMAVLDSNGHTVCDAEIELEITSPGGGKTYLTTKELASGNPEYDSFIIQKNPACGPESITSMPDYFAYYDFEEAGEYVIDIKAVTEKSAKKMQQTIYAENSSSVSIARIAATRIYPKADYEMKLIIQTKEDFSGSIKDRVPEGFKIKNYKLRIIDSDSRDPFGPNYEYKETLKGDGKEIAWHGLELLEGDRLEIIYQFDAPDISPEFYLLGPASLIGSSNVVFEEKRQWQLASDAVKNRARTVMFFAGANPGSSAQNTNANLTLTQFNFKLAENDVDIKNAYVMIESQLEAFLNTSGSYTGYTAAFDACEESCTASAFGASQRTSKTDNTVLAYDTIESMQSRILLDVTSEPQIAAYTGGGVLLEGQVGYHYMSSTTQAALAHTKAILVLTYTYDADSENITNTVTYPLEASGTSETPADSGSRQGVFGGTCTFAGANCPTFAYKMEIPEWGGAATSSNRVSQWFSMTEVNDSHGGTDVDIQVRVDSGAASNAFHHEAQNGSTQGNFPDMYFYNLNNYAENKTQTLEYQITDGSINSYLIGGEVFETYIASSSAPTKTRTVAFPLGVLENGVSTNWGAKSTNIYFPENGTATGTVKVKKAWVRLVSSSYQAARVTSLQTKVGVNATSSTWTYDTNTGGNIPKPAFSIYHVIPSNQYAELEKANTATSVPVVVNAQNSAADMGGISAELVITYTYTSEAKGYLTNLQVLGLQMNATASTTATGTTANLIFPEAGGKTIRGASLHTSYLSSDSTGTYPAGQFILDANISSTTPSCSNTYYSLADTTNMFTEHYKNVSSALSTTDGQSYNVCMTNNGNQFPATGGAKMNAVLSYVYSWVNTPPIGSFNSAEQKKDGSGTVDISIEVDDIDKHDSKAKIEFATGTSCIFSPAGDPNLDETDGNVSADFDDPDLENDNPYQIGTASAYIKTASGSNSVDFDWQALGDLGAVDGDYCLRLTVNDLLADQTVPATTTVYIDTTPPSPPGVLSLDSRTGTTLTLNFGATSTELNFSDYRIYYKIKDGSDPDEGDSVLSSTTDANLGDIEFYSAATTSISGLVASTTYSIAIWAYDIYGNKASSSRADITTNDAPTGYFYLLDTGQKKDGSGIVDISIKADDLNNHDTLKAKIEYEQGTACAFSPAFDPTLDENPANVFVAFGSVILDDDMEYQVGSSSAWIITSPGENTVDFDWWAFIDEPAADNTYCLRLTLNDRFDDMPVPATTTITVDNLTPTSTGNLSLGAVTTNSITLAYDTLNPGEDTNEPASNAYKIFYKQGTSGVTEGSTEHDSADLDAYDFGGATSTVVGVLDQNTWYVFNIWTYDEYGNKASATEVAIKTSATLNNNSLSLTNGLGYGTSTNVIIAGTSTEWNFRAVVSETNGWYSIGSSTLRLADNSDYSSPFSDLVFYWNQTDRKFYDISQDLQSAVSLSSNSTSTCAGISCTLDFKLLFNKNFETSGTNYSAELYSTNDFGTTDFDTYPLLYQVRFPYLEQTHYRWRYDNGGE